MERCIRVMKCKLFFGNLVTMSSGTWVCFSIIFTQILLMEAETNNIDTSTLISMKSLWQSVPSTWTGYDPCGSNWDGITCSGNRVISIVLVSMNLEGSLSGDIQKLTELQILDLSYNKRLTGTLPPAIGNLSKLTNLVLVGCGFFGPIPATIGSLSELYFLALNLNNFTGEIPASIGNLTQLYWLDLADNQLNGSIPVSDGKSTPGLDMLFQTNHFHFGNNKLSGSIPVALFSPDMSLIHLLLENNHLSGEVPMTLGLVKTLEVVRIDRNLLTGTLPSNLNNLTTVGQMILSNNLLNGTFPNLAGMNLLTYVDISNNSFGVSNVPSWLPPLQALTTLILENTNIQGVVPVELFSLPQLETLSLRRNHLNGSLDVGPGYSTQLRLVDLEQNNINSVHPRGNLSFQLILVNNPVCQRTPNASYCVDSQQPGMPYSTPPNNCITPSCISGQIPSPNCRCSYPYTGTLVFRAPSFSNLENHTYFTVLETLLMNYFSLNQLPVDSVSLSNATMDASYLNLMLQMFPLGQSRFNRTGITTVGSSLSNQKFKSPLSYGPYYFYPNDYTTFAPDEPLKSSTRLTTAAIIGIAVGGSIVVLLLLIAVILTLIFLKGTKRDEVANTRGFGRWNRNSLRSSISIPHASGARWFTLEELKKCTNNFNQANDIGSGGYGKVYKGALPNGQLVAVKRADPQSTQGEAEFKAEIELLSRVHHKNLVSLLGFCFEDGELMLVYEHVPNGTVGQSLSGKSGVRLDWRRRIGVTLGAARGLQYLHENAYPPIIHRDIKSSNILLDETLNAKVSDFGLSKSFMDGGKGHITTQVKGTMGYLDPEYYMTEMLTEKSDVYSFGVLMLEIITGKLPIERGRYIVREVKKALDKSQDLYNLHELLDPVIGLGTTLAGLEQFVDLALRCVEESGPKRPAMREVVNQLENIMQVAGFNPFSGSTSNSAALDSRRIGSHHPYPDSLYGYSGRVPR